MERISCTKFCKFQTFIQHFYLFQIRKNLQVVDKIRNDKKLQSINEVMATKLKELFDAVKSKERDEDEAKKAVLFTLFKTHHLLRTYVEEGIASLHGKKFVSNKEKNFFKLNVLFVLESYLE